MTQWQNVLFHSRIEIQQTIILTLEPILGIHLSPVYDYIYDVSMVIHCFFAFTQHCMNTTSLNHLSSYF